MTRHTPTEIYQAARAAGLNSASAIIAVAVALAESSGDDTALGDVSLQNNTWGPSVGVWQIRTLKQQTGTGGDRDIAALQGNIGRQAQAMANISNAGTNWTPWTTYTRGTYQKFMGQAQTAVGAADTSPVDLNVTPVSNPLTDVQGWIADQVSAAVQPARNLALKLTVGALGLGLILFGLARMVAPTVKQTVKTVQKTTADVAKAAI